MSTTRRPGAPSVVTMAVAALAGAAAGGLFYAMQLAGVFPADLRPFGVGVGVFLFIYGAAAVYPTGGLFQLLPAITMASAGVMLSRGVWPTALGAVLLAAVGLVASVVVARIQAAAQ